jgi:hypothetical protein
MTRAGTQRVRKAILGWFGPTLFAVSAFAACSDAGNAPAANGAGAAPDAASDRVNPNAGTGGRPNADLVFDATGPHLSEPDTGLATPDAGEQPLVPCGTDADSIDGAAADGETSAECEPPPSRCADSRFLVYYRDGTCVEGRCHWREDFYQCKEDCAGNGCISNRTAPAAN